MDDLDDRDGLSLVKALACELETLTDMMVRGPAEGMSVETMATNLASLHARRFLAVLARRAPKLLTRDDLVELMAGATVCIDSANTTLGFNTVENAAINAGWIATYEAARTRLMGALVAELSKPSRAGAAA
jgi:hypothetical protein